MMKAYEFLEHTADIKFKAYGNSPEELFINTAFALKESLTDEALEEEEKHKIKVRGKDWENLLYNFLEEILFLIDSKNFLFSTIKKIKINPKKLKLKAILKGNSEPHKFKTSIKAVTYNEMFVKKDKKGKWTAQVVLDI